MYFKKFLEEVRRGKLGLNKGLPIGLKKLGKEIDGLQKATNYLIGGETGTGKTAFVDHCFVLEPSLEVLNNPNFKLKIFYESYEIDKIRKLAKFVSNIIYRDTQRITSFKELLSRGDYNIPNDIDILLPHYEDKVENLFRNIIEIEDHKNHPTGIKIKVEDYMLAHGKFEEVEVISDNGEQIKQKIYVPNDPDLVVILIIDHIGLMRREKGYTKKENIDRMSDYCIQLRNVYGVSCVLISQFNRNLSDIDRQRFKEVQPQLDDFKDTGNVAEDSNIVIALFNPLRYGIKKYFNYIVAKCGHRLRTAHILKNRDGEDMIMIALNFLGENGFFREINKKPDEMTDKDYKQIKNFE